MFNGSYSNKSTAITQKYAGSSGSAKIRGTATLKANGFSASSVDDVSLFININAKGNANGYIQK